MAKFFAHLLIGSLVGATIAGCGVSDSTSRVVRKSESSIAGKTPGNFYKQFLFQGVADPSGTMSGTLVQSIDAIPLDDSGLVARFKFALLENGSFVVSYSETQSPSVSGAGASGSDLRTLVRRGTWSLVGSEIIFGTIGTGRGTTVIRSGKRSYGILLKLDGDIYSKGLRGRTILLSKDVVSGTGDPDAWRSDVL